MLEPGKFSGLAAHVDWSRTALGDAAHWPPALRLTADIVLNSPLPMLLCWGRERIVLFNEAYAALAGPSHPAAPGGNVPAMLPAPLAAARAAFEQALQGAPSRQAHQALTFISASGPLKRDCDLYFTPIRDGAGGARRAVRAGAERATGRRAGSRRPAHPGGRGQPRFAVPGVRDAQRLRLRSTTASPMARRRCKSWPPTTTTCCSPTSACPAFRASNWRAAQLARRSAAEGDLRLRPRRRPAAPGRVPLPVAAEALRNRPAAKSAGHIAQQLQA